MKFVVSSTAIFSHLQSISRVINSKNTLPILDSFLFDIKDGHLTITASDSETTLVTSLELNECDGDIRFAIVAKTILDALKEIPEQPITFEVSSSLEIMVFYQNGKYNLMAQNADEYPQPAVLNDSAVRVEIDAEIVLSAINCTLFASADDELRPVMNGVYFDITSENITMVASDGHKLVRYKTMSAKGAEERSAFILPKKPANLLKNILPKESGMVVIEFDERNAVFTLENYRMVCRLIEGRYPNYNSVIPQNNEHKVLVDRLLLLGALRRVSIFSAQSSSLIKLSLQENSMLVSAQDIDFSTSAQESLVCQYSGTVMSIGFKSNFLIDILNNISSKEVVIELADPSRAGLVVPAEQDDDEDLLMLLMPMMLND